MIVLNLVIVLMIGGGLILFKIDVNKWVLFGKVLMIVKKWICLIFNIMFLIIWISWFFFLVLVLGVFFLWNNIKWEILFLLGVFMIFRLCIFWEIVVCVVVML